MSVHTKYKYNKAIYNHSQPCLTYKSLFKIIYKRIQNNNITLNTEKKLKKMQFTCGTETVNLFSMLLSHDVRIEGYGILMQNIMV